MHINQLHPPAPDTMSSQNMNTLNSPETTLNQRKNNQIGNPTDNYDTNESKTGDLMSSLTSSAVDDTEDTFNLEKEITKYYEEKQLNKHGNISESREDNNNSSQNSPVFALQTARITISKRLAGVELFNNAMQMMIQAKSFGKLKGENQSNEVEIESNTLVVESTNNDVEVNVLDSEGSEPANQIVIELNAPVVEDSEALVEEVEISQEFDDLYGDLNAGDGLYADDTVEDNKPSSDTDLYSDLVDDMNIANKQLNANDLESSDKSAVTETQANLNGEVLWVEDSSYVPLPLPYVIPYSLQVGIHYNRCVAKAFTSLISVIGFIISATVVDVTSDERSKYCILVSEICFKFDEIISFKLDSVSISCFISTTFSLSYRFILLLDFSLPFAQLSYQNTELSSINLCFFVSQLS